MKRFVKITLQDMDNLLKPEKGWVRNVCGYEYVYDYKLPTFPDIIIKIMSSVNTGTGKGRNKGSDAIRIFAVRINSDGKIKGYVSSQRVERVTNWIGNLRKAYEVILAQVKEIKRKHPFL